jgi:pimeloyl-ACP methyl ester carboxylesterase
MGILRALSVLLILSSNLSLFAKSVSECHENKNILTAQILNKGLLRDHPIVLISGLFNEARKAEFNALKAELINYYHVPTEQIFTINPSSNQGFETNTNLISTSLRNIQSEFGKKVIVFAHSMGGTSMMLSALQNQDLIPDVVETTFLMQPAFGSQLATAVDDVCTKSPLLFLPACKTPRKYRAGLRSLKTPIVDKIFLKAISELKPETHQAIDENVFYLRASYTPGSARLGAGSRIVHNLLKMLYGPNDSAMVHSRQHLCGIGTDFELTVPGRHSAIVDGRQTDDETMLTKTFLRYMVESVGYN